MSSIVIAGDTSGSVELKAPSIAGSTVLNLPSTNGDIVTTGDVATVTPSMLSQKLTLETAKNATGTAVNFTGIPSWVKRITVLFRGLSTNGSAYKGIRIGSGGVIKSTGYAGSATYVGAAASSINFTTGIFLQSTGAGDVLDGMFEFVHFGNNIWVAKAVAGYSSAAGTNTSGGSVTLDGTLDILSLVTSNGTDTFDAGSINILYEG